MFGAFGVIQGRWWLFVGAAHFAGAAFLAWRVRQGWQRPYDEWHPDGFDLHALHDEHPSDADFVRALSAARMGKSGAVIAEAPEIAGRVASRLEISTPLPPEMQVAFAEMDEVVELSASRLTALTLGARPQPWWIEELSLRMPGSPAWRGY